MRDKPAMLALEDELAAYFARSGFMAVEVDDLPDGIPWLPPIDLEELDPARAAKGSGQIAVVDTLDARVAAIAIPRLTTAEIEALRLHAVPAAAEVDVDLEFDLVDGTEAADIATTLSEARAVLTEAWGAQPEPPPRPRTGRSITIPPVDAVAGSRAALVLEVEAPASRVSIPPLVFPHATLDIRAATRIVVAQRLARVELGDDSSIPWLAPVAISDAASKDELSVSVIIYDAQLEVPV